MEYRLIFIGLTALLAVAQTRQYYFVNTQLSWTGAQTFCKQHYTDLATLDNLTDVTAVLNTSSSYTGEAWIGLYDGWKWSQDNSSFYDVQNSYTNWKTGDVNDNDGDPDDNIILGDCVEVYYGYWIFRTCSDQLYFLCYNGTENGQPSFVFVTQLLNWTEAQSYCRQNYVDLISVTSAADTNLIQTIAGYNSAWIGLYRVDLWSDGSNSSFRYLADSQPPTGSDCVTSSFGNSGKWYKELCSSTYPFICYSIVTDNPKNVKVSGQSETSITLQWDKVAYGVSFVLQFNGTNTSISAPTGDGPVTFTVSSLTAGTEYTFTLFSVFENTTSSGVSITAFTAPPIPNNFRASGKNETSITLQWDKVNNNVSFVLLFNGSESYIFPPTGDGPVTFTVSSLTAGTEYTFTLFSVFENLMSSGEQLTAATALPGVSFAQTYPYYFVNTPLNWTNAQSYCRQYYTDLATLDNPTDVNAVINTSSSYNGEAWIGLYDSWKWSLEDGSVYNGQTSYTNWYLGEINDNDGDDDDNIGQGNCVVMSYGYLTYWTYLPCSSTFYSVCYNGTINDQPSFVLVTQYLTWTQAQSYCRQHYVDLASVRNQSDNNLIYNTARYNTVWIGLYRVELWSDGSNSSFRYWAVSQPPTSSDICVTSSFGDSGKWYEEICSQSYPFICYIDVTANPKNFKASGQNETSITLQWKVTYDVSFVLQFNGTNTSISASTGNGPVTYTVSSLTAGTEYNFTLFSVFENFTSSGEQLTAATAPLNTDSFELVGQNETSITLQWNPVNNVVSFFLQFNGTNISITPPTGDGPVTYTVSPLTAGTKFTFTLFSVFENVQSSGVSITADTVPPIPNNIRASGQNETSITLQWDKVNNDVSFVLQFNGANTSITPPTGYGPVTFTVSSLTATTEYTFTLFSVFENFISSGVSIAAFTAPPNPNNFRASGQNETSITLQWDTVNNVFNFVLQFKGIEMNIFSPTGDGPVNFTVPSLNTGTEYTFTLFSVFENVRSSGEQLTAATGLFGVGLPQTHLYYFVNNWLSWTDAQFFCRQYYTDLATLEDPADVNAVLNITSSYTGMVWIGLYDGLKWSLEDGSVYNGQNFYWDNDPFNDGDNDDDDLNGPGDCVTFLNAIWNSRTCSDQLYFVCYNGTVNGQPSFVLISQNLTWTQAQSYCRQNYVDLASVRNQVDNYLIQNIAGSYNVWIGLYRTQQWSDRSNSSFRYWASGQPAAGSDCVASSSGNSGKWSNEACSQSYPFICYSNVPDNPKNFKASGQNETSITLQWNKVTYGVSFVLQFNGANTNISAPTGDGPVTFTVSSLTAGTKYTFTLFSVFENISSSGEQLTAATVPLNTNGFELLGQSETSITLQWNQVNNGVGFILQFNGANTIISAPNGYGPVTFTVTSLTAATEYTFTLFSVVESITSSGVQLTAATAPPNSNNFRTSGHNETSITLQWNQVNNVFSFVLLFNGSETNISSPTGDGPVTYTVSSLTARTKYTFTLFSVFENVRSSGVSITADTGPDYVVVMDAKLKSRVSLTESEIEGYLAELFRRYGLPQDISVKARIVKP